MRPSRDKRQEQQAEAQPQTVPAEGFVVVTEIALSAPDKANIAADIRRHFPSAPIFVRDRMSRGAMERVQA